VGEDNPVRAIDVFADGPDLAKLEGTAGGREDEPAGGPTVNHLGNEEYDRASSHGSD
jgi:hypothetical protein